MQHTTAQAALLRMEAAANIQTKTHHSIPETLQQHSLPQYMNHGCKPVSADTYPYQHGRQRHACRQPLHPTTHLNTDSKSHTAHHLSLLWHISWAQGGGGGHAMRHATSHQLGPISCGMSAYVTLLCCHALAGIHAAQGGGRPAGTCACPGLYSCTNWTYAWSGPERQLPSHAI